MPEIQRQIFFYGGQYLVIFSDKATGLTLDFFQVDTREEAEEAELGDIPLLEAIH